MPENQNFLSQIILRRGREDDIMCISNSSYSHPTKHLPQRGLGQLYKRVSPVSSLHGIGGQLFRARLDTCRLSVNMIGKYIYVGLGSGVVAASLMSGVCIVWI